MSKPPKDMCCPVCTGAAMNLSGKADSRADRVREMGKCCCFHCDPPGLDDDRDDMELRM